MERYPEVIYTYIVSIRNYYRDAPAKYIISLEYTDDYYKNDEEQLPSRLDMCNQIINAYEKYNNAFKLGKTAKDKFRIEDEGYEEFFKLLAKYLRYLWD